MLPDIDELIAGIFRENQETGKFVYTREQLARLDGIIQALTFYEVDMTDSPTTIEGLLSDATKIARFINPNA